MTSVGESPELGSHVELRTLHLPDRDTAPIAKLTVGPDIPVMTTSRVLPSQSAESEH